jgi:hypothetical protein
VSGPRQLFSKSGARGALGLFVFICGIVEPEMKDKIGDKSRLILYGIIYSVKNVNRESDVLKQISF